MADKLDYKTDDGIAVLSLAEAPGGRPAVLDAETRAVLRDALDQAAADVHVDGVVITAEGRGFPGGLPVDEIAHGEAAPELGEICRTIEDFPKPVVAALRGDVVDGGLALALAAHARLAAAGTRLGFSAIRRGLVPGAGATQRLPHLVGAGPAIDMIFAGRMLGAESGHLRGLFRRIVARNVVGEAVQAARDLAAAGVPAPEEDLPPGLADPIGYQEAIAKRRKGPGALPPEAEAALKCIEAAQLLPLEAGLELEKALREELRESARAKGLIRATALETRSSATAQAPHRLTLLGDGAAAVALAQRALAAGLAVSVAEQRNDGAKELTRRVASQLEHEVARGRISGAAQAEQMARLSGGASEAVLGEAEFVIEACGAPLEAMAGLAALIGRATGGGVPVLMRSNMGLYAGELQPLLSARTFGVALNDRPGTASRGLAEVVVTGTADANAAAEAHALLRKLGYGVVICPAKDGLIAGRLKAAMLAASLWCVARGASPAAVDTALGWPLGPFHQADVEGLDGQEARLAQLGHAPAYGQFFKSYVDAGRDGRAAGQGTYSYTGTGAAGSFDKPARHIADAWRGGAESALMSPAAIRRRVWGALFSTGLRLLDEGSAIDAADIDLAGLEALGLPRASGGPMKTAEIRGLLTVKHELEAWAGDDPALWAVSDRLTEMIKNGEGFGF